MRNPCRDRTHALPLAAVAFIAGSSTLAQGNIVSAVTVIPGIATESGVVVKAYCHVKRQILNLMS